MDETGHGRLHVICLVVLLASAAVSCCIASEFKKATAKDIKLDGSLCSLARSPAFGLGIAALVCLFISQIVGTSTAAAKICSRKDKSGLTAAPGKRNRVAAIGLLLLSWISFGLAAILLGAGSSINNRQAYGKGWLDGNCYLVKDGVYVGAAALVVTTTLLTVGFMHTVRTRIHHNRTRKAEKAAKAEDHRICINSIVQLATSCHREEGDGPRIGCKPKGIN